MDNLIGISDNVTHDDGENRSVDRRGLLRLGGVAAAAGAAAVMIKPATAGASTSSDSLHVTNAGEGDAIVGDAINPSGSGRGVAGSSVAGAGVSGTTRGGGPGVRAFVDRGGRGSALFAWTGQAANSAPTVDARQDGIGDGCYSHIENLNNTGRAIFGRTSGLGIAVVASIANGRSAAPASRGITVGAGAGVEGTSAQGVGGKFAGRTAQVQLVPSDAGVHPPSGAPGQLFVDRANRLWFCKGGGDWRQLA